MIVGVFSFDGPMYKDIDGVYCNTTITDQMLERYFHVVDKLIVIIRTYKLNKKYSEAGLNKVLMQNCEVIELPNFSSVSGFLIEKPRFTKLIEDCIDRADLIFVRLPSVTSNIVVEIAINKKRKYLAEIGGCSWDAYWNHSLVGKFIAYYMFKKQRFAIENASYASYVTSEWLQKRYPTKGISVSASNVYVKSFDLDTFKKKKASFEGFDKSKVIKLGTAAAVDVKYKGQSTIIKAINYLVSKGYDVYYELIGVGDFSNLKKIAKKYHVENRVLHRGLLVSEDVLTWLDTLDIYVQPSKQEGLPRALIEAMSRGLPAIGTNVAGIPELLSSDMIFKKGDTKSFVRVFEYLVNSDVSYYSEMNFCKSKEYSIEKLNDTRNDLFTKFSASLLGNGDL